MYLRARIPVTFSHSTIYIGLQRRGYIPTLKNETDVNGFEHRVLAASSTGHQIFADILKVVK